MLEMTNLEKLIEYEVRRWSSPGIPSLSLEQICSDIANLGINGWNVGRNLEKKGFLKENYNQETFRSIVFPYHRDDADAKYFATLYTSANKESSSLTAVFASAQEKYRAEMTNLRKLFEYEVRTRGVLVPGIPCLTIEDMLRDIEDLKEYGWDVESLLEAKKAKNLICGFLAKKDYHRERFYRLLTCRDPFDDDFEVAPTWGYLYSDVWKYSDITKDYEPVYPPYDRLNERHNHVYPP